MKRHFALGMVLFLLLGPLVLLGQEKEKQEEEKEEKRGKLDLTLRYLLLATKKTKTMQKELSEAAAAGYRILVGSPTSGVEMALILEKVAEPPNTYEYMLLATTRTGTMQKELNEAAEKGFRLLPRTMISKKQMFGAEEVVVVLEKAPNATQHYRYLLLATTRTGTLQKEMSAAINEGYELVGMVSRGEHMAILEKATTQ